MQEGEGLPDFPNTVAPGPGDYPPASSSEPCVRWGQGGNEGPCLPSTLNLGPHWADGLKGACTTARKRLSMRGQEALGTALAWKQLQKRGSPTRLLRAGLPSLVPEGEAGALLWPLPGTMALGSERDPGEGEEREGRDVPRGPRWSSGQLLLGRGPGRITSAAPNQLQKPPGCPGCPGRPGLRSRGPGRGCTAFCGRSRLRKPPGPAGGSG